VVEATDQECPINYSKTDLGEKLNALLKGHEYFGSLLKNWGEAGLILPWKEHAPL
jgi:hypothetical protein